MQVKSGWSTVPRDAGSLPVEAADRIYVFSPTGTYGENPAPNVTAIAFNELTGFMGNEPTCLPLRSSTGQGLRRAADRSTPSDAGPILKRR